MLKCHINKRISNFIIHLVKLLNPFVDVSNNMIEDTKDYYDTCFDVIDSDSDEDIKSTIMIRKEMTIDESEFVDDDGFISTSARKIKKKLKKVDADKKLKEQSCNEKELIHINCFFNDRDIFELDNNDRDIFDLDINEE